MIKNFKFFVNSVCLILILVGIQNCAPFEPTGLSMNSSSSADAQMADSFSKTLQPTLVSNCASCHGVNQAPMFAVLDSMSAFRALMQNNLVDVNTPANSLLITKLQAGHNGISATVTASVAQGIQDWVDVMNSDTTAPTVKVDRPANAASVSGSLTVTAVATDNVGVVGVQFLVDDIATGSEDLTDPYFTIVDTTALSNGSHTLKARARDAAGIIAVSAAVTITVNNTTPDVTAPVVSIAAPLANAVLTGNVPFTANATDNVRVAGVQFYVNGIATGAEDLTTPYSITLTTTSVTNGTYMLTARARDAAGNMTTSAAVTVTVNNPPANPNATYTYINTNIMPKCTACHGAARADAGIRYNTFANTIGTGSVVAKNAGASSFFTSCNNGSMPIGGAKLSAVQLKAIQDWINNGALNN